MDLTTIRGKYTTKNFDIKDLNKNPFKQFEVWFNDALNENLLKVRDKYGIDIVKYASEA